MSASALCSKNTALSFSMIGFIALATLGGCSSGSGGSGARGGSGGASSTGGASGSNGGGTGGAAGSTGAAGSDGGGGTGGAISSLTVTLAPLGGGTAAGTATFEKVGNGDMMKLTVNVTGVTPVSAQHGIHIHTNPDCGSSSDGDGGTTIGGAAGGHWNPESHDHGMSPTAGHLGDIGNITVDASGAGSLSDFITDKWTLGTGATNDILNHALILHAAMDDGVSQPVGMAGGRIACAIIR